MGTIKRRRLDMDGWLALLRRFAGSGLTVPAFCRRESISAASFYRWRGVLDGPPPRGAASMEVSARESVGFVDLGTLDAAPASARLEFKLDLGGGLVLHLVRG